MVSLPVRESPLPQIDVLRRALLRGAGALGDLAVNVLSEHDLTPVEIRYARRVLACTAMLEGMLRGIAPDGGEE